MGDIYQDIWDADQAGSGLKALLHTDAEAPADGYVKVLTAGGDADHRILTEVSLPASKTRSYDLVRGLFDNYALDEQDPEDETQEERQEVHDLLEAIVDSPPMQVARAYVAEATGTTISVDRWYALLTEHWFRRFSAGGDPELSGFEHVLVGEQEGAKVQGYHFWYKYWLDDGLAGKIDRNRLPGFRDDRIQYERDHSTPDQRAFPESVTIAYRWDAPDYDRGALRPLVKPKGGFFVGCSVEGLLALGSVRAHVAARAPKEAVINGARYDMKLFRSPDDKNIRTFYPLFLGPAGPSPQVAPGVLPPIDPAFAPGPVVGGAVRIVSAVVNPVGIDHGQETVTLMNTGKETVDLSGWFIVDKSRRRYGIPALVLDAGTASTIRLPADGAQLGNNGGEIRLISREGHTAHLVAYSKAQARREGETIVF